MKSAPRETRFPPHMSPSSQAVTARPHGEYRSQIPDDAIQNFLKRAAGGQRDLPTRSAPHPSAREPQPATSDPW
jgi:hypothetical protein